MLYFLINHDTGIIESAETMELAAELMESWIEHGTNPEDISVHEGRRVKFGIRTIREVVFNAADKTHIN